MRLFPIDDFVTLEYNDRVQLSFFPSNTLLFTTLEDQGEFIRHTTIVNIIDNDSKCFYSIIILCIKFCFSPPRTGDKF